MRGRIVEVGYDAPHPGGLAIAYCNLFEEAGRTGMYAPYLRTSDTAKKYDEGQIDPAGKGWLLNLRRQFDLRRSQGFEYVELDNPDAYSVKDVVGAVELAGNYGLKVVAKNPAVMEGDPTPYVALCHGIIVEHGAGQPAPYDALRKRAGKPDMPVWFVYFGDTRKIAQQTALAISVGKFKNMSVTIASEGEYENSLDVLLPIT
jgi:hypothetical protein